MFPDLIHRRSANLWTSLARLDCPTPREVGNDGDAGNPIYVAAMSTAASIPPSAFEWPCDEYICWSRMQAEAGQDLEVIIARKERERRAGGGAFLWGVGNAPAAITNVLARTGLPVRAVFSIMKSRPKPVDANPSKVVAWRRYLDSNNVTRDLPAHALVTSRADSALGPKKVHYALMCHSSEPLALRRGVESFDPTAFRNAGGTGAPVGHSQVTALLKRVDQKAIPSDYEVNLSAWLTDGYWVRLIDPVDITSTSSTSAAVTIAAECFRRSS
jgi:hypothetical protein